MRLDEETVEGQTVAYGYTGELLTTMCAMTAAYVPGTGQLDTTTLGNVETSYTYDGFGDLAGILYEASNSPVYEVTYTRDTSGRVQTKTETRGATTMLRCYEYDASDRLAGVFDAADSAGCTGAQLEAYGYDTNGNRQSVTNSGGSVPAVQIVTDDQDRLLQHGVFAYEYNDDGQMTSREDTSSGDVWAYTYDAVGNLREVDPPGIGGTISYVIDPRNRRVGRRVDGTLVQGFLYGDQLNPIAELDGSGAVVSRFVYGTSDHVPDYMVRGGTTYRFETDHLGSVVGVIDLSTGSEVQRREYDAYGRILSATSWTAAGFSQPFGFAGGLYDEGTGLVRFGARDYRPEVGSWAAKDPLRFGGGASAFYSYSAGDPTNKNDVDGLHPAVAGGAAAGCLVNPACAAALANLAAHAVGATVAAATVVCIWSGACVPARAAEDDEVCDPRDPPANGRDYPEITEPWYLPGEPPDRKEPCYAKYLRDTANCGEYYTVDAQYDACMDRSWTNYIRCMNGSSPTGYPTSGRAGPR